MSLARVARGSVGWARWHLDPRRLGPSARRACDRTLNRITGGRTAVVGHGVAAGLRVLGGPSGWDTLDGGDEIPVQEAIARHLRPGGVFWDVGSNFGFFAVLAARRVGPDGRVYAFEPVPTNAQRIRRNAALNALSQLRVLERAVGATSGRAELQLTAHPGGATLVSTGIVPQDATGVIAVQQVALDDALAAGELEPPDVVKIDVEGAEIEVLRGMEATLARHRPVLVYEVDDGDAECFRARREVLRGFLRRRGYRIEELPDSYPHIAWIVGHDLALPHAGSAP